MGGVYSFSFLLVLQVVARDEESGEEASAVVDVEVLQRGQAGGKDRRDLRTMTQTTGGFWFCQI